MYNDMFYDLDKKIYSKSNISDYSMVIGQYNPLNKKIPPTFVYSKDVSGYIFVPVNKNNVLDNYPIVLMIKESDTTFKFILGDNLSELLNKLSLDQIEYSTILPTKCIDGNNLDNTHTILFKIYNHKLGIGLNYFRFIPEIFLNKFLFSKKNKIVVNGNIQEINFAGFPSPIHEMLNVFLYTYSGYEKFLVIDQNGMIKSVHDNDPLIFVKSGEIVPWYTKYTKINDRLVRFLNYKTNDFTFIFQIESKRLGLNVPHRYLTCKLDLKRIIALNTRTEDIEKRCVECLREMYRPKESSIDTRIDLIKRNFLNRISA